MSHDIVGLLGIVAFALIMGAMLVFYLWNSLKESEKKIDNAAQEAHNEATRILEEMLRERLRKIEEPETFYWLYTTAGQRAVLTSRTGNINRVADYCRSNYSEGGTLRRITYAEYKRIHAEINAYNASRRSVTYDAYEILGVSRNDDMKTIRSQFHKLAFQCHSDITHGDDERMKRYTAAYTTIKREIEK